EQLNLRLHDHQPHKLILPWLNSLPETKAVLAAHFDNRPITKQNLSEWKQGGFRDWLLQYHASQFLQFTDPCSRRGNEPDTPDEPTVAVHSNVTLQPNTEAASLAPSDGERARGEGSFAHDSPIYQQPQRFCILHSSLCINF